MSLLLLIQTSPNITIPLLCIMRICANSPICYLLSFGINKIFFGVKFGVLAGGGVKG